MSAELLREAAALMRENAEAARDNDECGTHWVAAPRLDADNNGWLVAYEPQNDGFDDLIALAPYDYEGKLARHLSGWHPAVALAVADWLDATASENDAPEDSALGFLNFACADELAALAVARLYLGRDS